jgi:hypothetical protein
MVAGVDAGEFTTTPTDMTDEPPIGASNKNFPVSVEVGRMPIKERGDQPTQTYRDMRFPVSIETRTGDSE